MAGLVYREDMEEVRDRLRRWWNGEDLGRPVLLLTAPREKSLLDIPPVREPEGWVTDYSTRDFAYRVYLGARWCASTHYLGEAAPNVAPDLAPNCLALYLGCRGIEISNSVWCAPCIDSPETAQFALDRDNFYWQFSLRLGRELLRIGRGKFLVSFPDLIEGLDTLEAMRGGERLLEDLLVRPEWVRECLRQITERYFECYDPLYRMFRDETGGSTFWMWAPGRMAKLQCDFSAMIGPEMYGEFMVPVLRAMTERLDYAMYHWDGPQALVHHDHLLSIPRLHALQWTPGAAYEPPPHRRWWPYFHRTVEAGKRVILDHGVTLDDLTPLRREFGRKLHRFAIAVSLESPRQVDDVLQRVAG